ncbi:hypothetical protein R6Q59_004350 [Mikania micrantha]
MLGSLPILPLPAPPSDGNLGPLPPSQVENDSKDVHMQDGDDGEKNPPPASIATHTRTIGIIHPPPDIRTIVDKTASFVAKNGPEFEKRIIVSNAGNPKFNFLNGSDPYHAYYQHRLSEFRAQNQPQGSSYLSQPMHQILSQPRLQFLQMAMMQLRKLTHQQSLGLLGKFWTPRG